ncbi:MAG: hypothetical protein AB7G44_03205 [Bacteroidia bacterium]
MQTIKVKSSFVSILTSAIWSWLTFGFRWIFRSIFSTTSENSRKDEIEGEKDWDKQKLIPVGFTDLIRPWHLIVDIDKKQIVVKKRNWFLIGMDEKTYQFNTVRNVQINNHLFGSNILIQVYAGKAVAYCISKSEAQQIKEVLLNKNWSKSDSVDILIDTDSEVSI